MIVRREALPPSFASAVRRGAAPRSISRLQRALLRAFLALAAAVNIAEIARGLMERWP